MRASTALLIEPSAVSGFLGMPPTEAWEPGQNSGFLDGAGCRLLAADEPALVSIDDQIQKLVSRLAALGSKLQQLRESGCDVRGDICGTAETGSRLRLAAGCHQQLALLGIPLSFTTTMTDDSQEDDDLLDWLPPADGSRGAE